MLDLVHDILESRLVTDADGNEYSVRAETPLSQCEFLQGIIHSIDARRCIEIGLAFGISSMFIGEAIHDKAGCRLISVDPMQRDEWSNVGLTNMERCGFSRFLEFHEDYSFNVLPELAAEGAEIDFAYVDTTKVFDFVLLDAFYLTRLLRVGGVLVLDDCTWPGLRKLVRYIAKWPYLEVYQRHFEYKNSASKHFLSVLANRIPGRRRLFADDLLVLDESSGTNAKCVAFKKTRDDCRAWDWFAHF